MVFEEIEIKPGDTLSQVANDYGYNRWDWEKIWEHHGNDELKRERIKPNNIQAGDQVIIPLPWKMISKSLIPHTKSHGGKTFVIRAKRDGVKGKNLRWVQTVFQDNQPIGLTDTFCADACPGDDNDPFYYTSVELITDPNRRSSFFDAPWRNPHATKSTAWRAVLSLCSVAHFRVSIFESIVWGIDFGKNGVNTNYMPRQATSYEISGHLRLLKIGKGKTRSFKSGGWSFREAPKKY